MSEVTPETTKEERLERVLPWIDEIMKPRNDGRNIVQMAVETLQGLSKLAEEHEKRIASLEIQLQEALKQQQS
jgi:uncharacterized protein (UPF0147 family)